MRAILEKAVLAGELREIDLHAALFLQQLAGKSSGELLLAGALASRAVGDGHICLPLPLAAGREVFAAVPCRAPELADWRECLQASGVAGLSGKDYPLVLDGTDRLYLGRYFEYEKCIGEDLLIRSREGTFPDMEEAAALINELFPGSRAGDRQKLAAAAAALRKFTVISGGPGTGKTYTVARILILLYRLAGTKLRIGLAAPTGKAAVRLQESITAALQSIGGDQDVMVPAETKTLHRLLGYRPDREEFRHNRSNKLHLDLLIIDEASMIDVPMMAALVEALPRKTSLILVGDRNQLTSVEAGSLLGDICARGEPPWSEGQCTRVAQLAGWAPEPVGKAETFGDSIILLHRSHRFESGRGIARLAHAVQTGDLDRLQSLQAEPCEDLVFAGSGGPDLPDGFAEDLLEGYGPVFTADEPGQALHAMNRFRILCAVREGTFGITGLNLLAEKILRTHGYIGSPEQWYPGRPLIIRSNHYGLQLFNGDTGIVWPDAEGRPWAWFPRPDTSLHQVPLSRLPGHESAYAITVHQSQGSEFDRVLFLLPPGDSPILSRELLYTGITRAKEKLVLYGHPDTLAAAMARNEVRHSGLRERLWGGNQ